MNTTSGAFIPFVPLAIKVECMNELEMINNLYCNHFDFLDKEILPCYVLIAGYENKDLTYFGDNCSNKNEILKDYKIMSIDEAVKIGFNIPENIKEANRLEMLEIDSIFTTLVNS